jgi:hypothetical protein
LAATLRDVGEKSKRAKDLKPAADQPAGPKLTKMGERIVMFMKANGLTNRSQFAEGTLGISRQRFHRWLYVELGDVEARPLIRCAEVLTTNPDYLLGDSDDPRPAMALEAREFELVQAYRVLSEVDQDRLLQTAAAWVGQAESAPSTSAPFRLKYPPATAPETAPAPAVHETNPKERK